MKQSEAYELFDFSNKEWNLFGIGHEMVVFTLNGSLVTSRCKNLSADETREIMHSYMKQLPYYGCTQPQTMEFLETVLRTHFK